VVSEKNLDGSLVNLHTDDISALRALQNPNLFTSEHYKQAAIAVAAGIAIRLLISIPVSIVVPTDLVGADVYLCPDYWHKSVALVPVLHSGL
jgi:hypothetical protein